MSEETIESYLTEWGYLKKTSLEAPKTDYYVDLSASVSFTREMEKKVGPEVRSQVHTAGDVYEEAIVSFTERGKVVISNYYTALGERIAGKQAESLEGNYTVSTTPEPGTTLYHIRAVLERAGETKTVDFYLDAVDGILTRGDWFRNEPFRLFTTAEVLANSGAAYKEESWSEENGSVLYDVAYGEEVRNLMDVYIPAGFEPSKDNGIIMCIHGGSWVSGSKEEMANQCKKFAKMGYFAVAINHSYAMSQLSDGTPATLLTINREVGKAFTKLKELSDKYNWNFTAAAVSGYSSGCHVAYLYGYSDGNEADAPIPVKMVFGMVGCMDFREEYWRNVSTDGPGVAALGLQDDRLISTDNPYTEAEYNAIVDTISPLAYAKRGDAVPSVMAQAKLDESLIDWQNGAALEEALQAWGIPMELYLLPNSGHITGNNPYLIKAYEKSVWAYLSTYLGT